MSIAISNASSAATLNLKRTTLKRPPTGKFGWATVLFSVVILGSWPNAAFGQVSQGSIVGHTTDESGALLQRVDMTVINVGTNIERTAVSNDSGAYVIPLLNPGIYLVRAEKVGFQTQLATDIQVEVARETRVDFTMTIAKTAAAVTVTAAAPLLQTTNGTIGHIVTAKQIVDLPLNGRDFMELAVLSPGVVTPGPAARLAANQGAAVAGAHLPSIAGSRTGSTNVTLDGFANTRPWDQTPVIRPSIDAIQEFRIQTSSATAENIRNVGGIHIATKAGTNQFRGTLFGFYRSNALESVTTPLKQSQFGGVLSGPVRIPKLYDGRNKTFFMMNWEDRRYRTGSTLSAHYPTEAMRLGDFSNLRDAAGNLIPIYDPATTNPITGQRQQFPGNIIPSNRIDPIARNMLQFFPPTTGEQFPNTFRALTTPTDDDMVIVRADHQLGRNSFLARLNWQRQTKYNPSLLNLGGNYVNQRSLSGGIAWTRSLSSSVVNVARVGYFRSGSYQIQEASFLNRNLSTEVGIRNGPEFFSRVAYAMPAIVLQGGAFAGTGGPQSFQGIAQNWQFEDSLTFVKGDHTVSLGAAIHRSRTQWGSGGATGYYFFNGQYSAQLGNNLARTPGTGAPSADFLLGQTLQTFLTSDGGLGDYDDTSYFTFVSDTWRMSPKLTLSYGLNWQYIGPYIERHGRMSFPDFSAASFAMGGRQLNTCRPTDAYHPVYNPGNNFETIIDESLCIRDPGEGARYYNNFGPRLGIAYMAQEKTVVRLGAGQIFDAHQQASQMAGMSGNPPFPIFYNMVSNDPRQTSYPLRDLFPPFSELAPQTTGRVVGPKLEGRRRPYVIQWNASVERQLSPHMVLELGYMGSVSRNLETRYGWNQARPDPPGVRTPIDSRRPFPNFPGPLMELHEMVGSAKYNAVFARFEHRFSKGLSAHAAYTWSAALGTGGTNFYYAQTAQGTEVQNPNCLECEYSRLDEDVPHRFVTSVSYELPVGRGKRYLTRLNGLGEALLGGWQINALGTYQSGTPFSIFDNTDSANIGLFTARADYSPGYNSPPPLQDFEKTGFYFDPSYFKRREPGQPYGNTGRNIMRLAPFRNWDMSLFKNIHSGGTSYLQFRVEAYNVFGRLQGAAPIMNVAVGNFGRVAPGSEGYGRNIQVALKWYF